MMKRVTDMIEYIAVLLLFGALRALPIDVASWIGGKLARAIGPSLRAHKIAQRNLSMIFPDMSERERRALLSAMWNNLGRTAAELPHLPDEALHKRVTISGIEHLSAAGHPTIFFSGHLGNWELTYPMAHRHGIPVTLVYRKANNPYVDKLIARIRATQSTRMFAKGPSGAVALMRAIKDGQTLGMLVDQKMNDGIPVPFFGRPAMTAPAIADLALRYDMPLIPLRVVRTKGAHFNVIIYPPLTLEKTGDEDKDILTAMTQINALLESWIREYPAQWFWVHKRWPNA